MALSTFRARLQAFINDPNVNTLGLRLNFEVASSKISKAFFSLVGLALAQASMAPFIIRILGRSMLSNSLRASSVLPLRPKPTIFRERSAFESLREDGDEEDVSIVVAINREEDDGGVKDLRCKDDVESFSSLNDGPEASFHRVNVDFADSGTKACPFSVEKRRTKQKANSVVATAACCRRRRFSGPLIVVELVFVILDFATIVFSAWRTLPGSRLFHQLGKVMRTRHRP
mmetsp:Transcript_21377/g.59448  ORF Transcript_21377/g.59448 Transcript_21377/m.59448 type:complete len:230 (-) Transcript_21377:44-733(-)